MYLANASLDLDMISIIRHKLYFYPVLELILTDAKLFSYPAKECKTIEVFTNTIYHQIHGIYETLKEHSQNGTSNPVWKNPAEDYYFFNHGTNWAIGSPNVITTELQASYHGTYSLFISIY